MKTIIAISILCGVCFWAGYDTAKRNNEVKLWLSYSKDHVALQRIPKEHHYDMATYLPNTLLFEDDIQEGHAKGTEVLIK